MRAVSPSEVWRGVETQGLKNCFAEPLCIRCFVKFLQNLVILLRSLTTVSARARTIIKTEIITRSSTMQAPTVPVDSGLKIKLPYERQDRVSFDTTMAQFEQEEAVLEARNADNQQQALSDSQPEQSPGKLASSQQCNSVTIAFMRLVWVGLVLVTLVLFTVLATMVARPPSQGLHALAAPYAMDVGCFEECVDALPSPPQGTMQCKATCGWGVSPSADVIRGLYPPI